MSPDVQTFLKPGKLTGEMCSQLTIIQIDMHLYKEKKRTEHHKPHTTLSVLYSRRVSIAPQPECSIDGLCSSAP